MVAHPLTEPAIFLERPNRFVIVARLADGRTVRAHCADPGRLRELLVPGVTVHLSRAADPARRTAYSLRFVEHPLHGQLVSLDTQLPNRVVAEGLAQGALPPFERYSVVEREVRLNHEAGAGTPVSRIDFRLRGGGDGEPLCWLEVKSVTLVEGRTALFPDAPTARGRRHLEALAARAGEGERAAVLFLVQRPDADHLRPHWRTDPAFARTLAQVHAAGVELYAYTCTLTLQQITLARQIPVELELPSTGAS